MSTLSAKTREAVREIVDHKQADLRGRIIEEADARGPIRKYVEMARKAGDDYVLVEHGIPYWAEDEEVALTLVVRRADDLWLWLRYIHADGRRWNLDAVTASTVEPGASRDYVRTRDFKRAHGYEPVEHLSLTNASAEWVLTQPLDDVVADLRGHIMKQTREAITEALKEAEARAEKARDDVAQADKAVALMKAERRGLAKSA